MNGVEVVTSPALGEIPHGFLGRVGGVSIGVVAGLNTGWGSGDERAAISENRARKFYERWGFVAEGRYAFMVGSHADEDVVMRRPL